MRIAHLTWSLGIGGIQTMLTEIVNEQVKSGHEVGIFVIDTYVSETIVNKLNSCVKVFFMGRTRGTKSIWPFVKLNWELRKFAPDIIHSHAGKLAKVIFTRVPMVATVHSMGTLPSDYSRYCKKFAISEAVKKDWIKSGCDDLTVIENGIPCDKIKNKTNFKIGDTIHVVQVSRIFFQPKRQDLVVHAFTILRERMQNDPKLKEKRCVTHFVGDGNDLPRLKEIVYKQGMGNDIVFEGFKDRDWVYEHLCDFDLFLQPSDNEGFGLTVAEACAAKIPVLVSDVDGPLEVIDYGKLGMVFKHGDAEDLCNQLMSFLNDGYDKSQIEKAYQKTIQKYDVSRTTHRYLDEYEKVLNSK